VNLDVVADRFRLLAALGKGNMGEVHRALDLEDDHREVAVKLILRSRSGTVLNSRQDVKAVQRFDRQVRIMRRLRHRNLPHTIAGGVDASGLPYLAMELFDGESLSDLISEHPQLPISWATALGAQIADALSAAHAVGVIHRDLKPSNVMLLRGGLVKVLDFGMGRIIGDIESIKVTSTGVTVGTARYMAPEQFLASAVTQAADLYALGCVLFELLTGVPPFHSESAHELGQKHLNERPPPVKLLRSDVPEELARLVERLLAKDPADRPADAVAVREALLPLTQTTGQAPGWEEFDPTGCLKTRPTERSAAAVPEPRQAGSGMDVFGVHQQLIKDYRSFTEGGTVIRDDRIAAFVEDDLDAKSQWPDPWVSPNPFFKSSGTVWEAVQDKILHPECARIFQERKTEGGTVCDGRPLTLHQHQLEAVKTAQESGNGRRAGVPGLRRAAHLPWQAGRRRRPAHPPGA
jgi:serine/threonine protein kinase